MAQILLEGVTQEMLDAVSSEYNYNQATDGTKKRFTEKVIARFLKKTLKEYRNSTEVKTLRDSIDSQVEAIEIT